MELQKYKLGDIADFNKSTLNKSDSIKEIVYLDTSSITENIISDTVTLDIEEAPSRAQRKVKHYTIIYSTIRPRLKHYGILKNPNSNLIVSTGFITIDIKKEYKEYIDSRYLYLLLTQPSITEYIGNIADTAVSAYPSINPSNISALSFNFPELCIQKSIANIWENYDQKIALNRKINDNLEAMAKQLYDYWFVQFDFPNEEGKPYKSSGGKMVWNEKLKREIPEGWEVKTIGTFADVKRGSTITKAQTVVGDIKVVAAATDYSFLHNKANRSAYVITVSASGANAGFINFWREPIYASDCSTIQCKDVVETLYCYYWIRHFQELLFTQQIGAAQPHVYPEHINKIPIVIPPQLLLDKIRKLLVRANKQQGELTKQIANLTKQRDELLPLLMNGQVSVNYD